jgi:hypothetical protein
MVSYFIMRINEDGVLVVGYRGKSSILQLLMLLCDLSVTGYDEYYFVCGAMDRALTDYSK